MATKLNNIIHVDKLEREELERRQRRRDILKAEADLRDKEAREASYKRTWGWKAEGQTSLKNFKNRFGNVKGILLPHEHKKKNVMELKIYIKRAKLQNENLIPVRSLFRSVKLLARAARANALAVSRIAPQALDTSEEAKRRFEVEEVVGTLLDRLEVDEVLVEVVCSVVSASVSEGEVRGASSSVDDLTSNGDDLTGDVVQENSEVSPNTNGNNLSPVTSVGFTQADSSDHPPPPHDVTHLSVENMSISISDKDKDEADALILQPQSRQTSFVSQLGGDEDESSLGSEFIGHQYMQKSCDEDTDEVSLGSAFIGNQYLPQDQEGQEQQNQQQEDEQEEPPSQEQHQEQLDDLKHEDRCLEQQVVELEREQEPQLEVESQLDEESEKVTFDVGDHVLCNYGGFGHWYPGTVSSIHNDSAARVSRYDISFDDGDSEDSVEPERIRRNSEERREEVLVQPLEEEEEEEERERESGSGNRRVVPTRNFDTEDNRTRWEDSLEGLPQGEELTAATVAIAVKEEEEEEGEELPLSTAAATGSLDECDLVAVVNPVDQRVNLFMVGDTVLCDYCEQGQWCAGVISASRAGGVYDIDYLDGDSETDKAEHCIIEMPTASASAQAGSDQNWHIGDKVLCNYHDKGIWFQGVVKNYKKTHTMGVVVSIDVQYCDGDVEVDVSPHNVIPRPSSGVSTGKDDDDDADLDDDAYGSEPMLAIQGSSFVPRNSNHLEGRMFKKMSQKVINAVKPFHLRTRQKSKVIHLKHVVMRQLYKEAFSRKFAKDPEQTYVPATLEHVAIKPMLLDYSRRIPLPRSLVNELQGIRRKVEEAKILYKRTVAGIDKCRAMLECKSIYHYKMSGCPKCGAMFVGDVLQMHTFDRATKASIVTTRDFEVNILAEELVRYEANYLQELDKIRSLEADLREKTVYDIQAWWASTLAWRRAHRQHLRLEKSSYWFRIRRLVKMKRAIDSFDSTKTQMNDLEDIFCDVIPEMREYRIHKKAKATNIAAWWGRKLLAKARARLSNGAWKAQKMQEHIEATKLARQLRRIEEITIAEELRQDLHALADEISRREWTCPRFECHRHKFLSKARYDTHMKVHRLMDVEVEEARRKVFEEKMRRMGEEEQIIRQIRAVKAGVLEIGGDLERDGNPTLKNQRLTVGSRPYLLIPQRPDELREEHIRAKARAKMKESERAQREADQLRLLRLTLAAAEEVAPEAVIAITDMPGRHEENGINDIMKELDIVTKFGANLQMFEKSKLVKPLEVENAFDAQERLEREAEEKRVADLSSFNHLADTASDQVEEKVLEEVYHEIFALGYSELPQLLALGYHRLPPPANVTLASKGVDNSKKKRTGAGGEIVNREYGYKKIDRDAPHAENSLVLFPRSVTLQQGGGLSPPDPKKVVSLSMSLPLPPVNQADLQCRHDSTLNYEITYQIKTGKRFTNKLEDESYTLAFSNITHMPNPNPPLKKLSKHSKYRSTSRPSSSGDLVWGSDMNTTSDVADREMLMISDQATGAGESAVVVPGAGGVSALGKEAERERERERDKELSLSLSRLGSNYIDDQVRNRRLRAPDWMSLPHRLRLNESIHTQKFVTFEIVSMAKCIELMDSEYIMNKPIIRFGTLDACDYTIKCHHNNNQSVTAAAAPGAAVTAASGGGGGVGGGGGGDIRKERSLSKIHCMVYVPLLPTQPHEEKHNNRSSRGGAGGGKQKKYAKSYDSDSSDDDNNDDAEARAQRLSDEKRANQVTIVDNHSTWGTYVVTQRGVRKVPTTIQAGVPLEHGDLICMGVARHGPPVMTPLEANRALLVFRVRTDYCVTIGKVPEFDVGGMILSEQEKFERPERAEYR